MPVNCIIIFNSKSPTVLISLILMDNTSIELNLFIGVRLIVQI
jgi:hypothetical protein